MMLRTKTPNIALRLKYSARRKMQRLAKDQSSRFQNSSVFCSAFQWVLKYLSSHFLRVPLHPQLTTTKYHSSDTQSHGTGVLLTCHHKTCPRTLSKIAAYNTSVAQQTFPTVLENLQKCEKATLEYFPPFTINISNMRLFRKVILAAALPYGNL